LKLEKIIKDKVHLHQRASVEEVALETPPWKMQIQARHQLMGSELFFKPRFHAELVVRKNQWICWPP